MAPESQSQTGRSSGTFQSSGALSELAMRSASQWFDVQVNALRTLWETQARAAAAFGLPDYSGLMPGMNEERLRDVLNSSTERMVSTARRTGDAAAQIQRRIGSILETQTHTAAETWQQGIERLSEQTDDALEQLCRTAQQQADQLEQATQSAGETVRQGLQASSDQVRQGMRESNQRGSEALSHMGEATRQQSDAARSTDSAARAGQAAGSQASNDEKQKRERSAAAAG